MQRIIVLAIGFSWFTLSSIVGTSTASADCTEFATPEISAIVHEPNSNQVTIQWTYAPGTFCIWPPDFYQVRWTESEGPSTQSQSPQINSNQASASWTLSGVDPNRLYGFIVQACKSSFLGSSNCTSWSPMRYYKPYGPAMCRSGFVWREAYPGDVVCVTPQTRTETKADNEAGPSRIAANPPYCKVGFVWRAARPSDLVCVTPETRQLTAQDNAAASSRVLP